MPPHLKAITIDERLKPASYIIGRACKWGLTPNAQINNINKWNIVPEQEKQRFMPKEHRFDEYFIGQKLEYYINIGINVSKF